MRIPFNKPGLTGHESDYVEQALNSGKLSGDGRFTRACEALLSEALGSEKILLTASGTDALELAALLCEVQPDDEVIMPSFTFSSTANAFCLRGAKPVFVDVRPDTLNLDEEQVADAITPRTRAIVPVHYGGIACEMDKLCEIGRHSGAVVIEDAAHGISLIKFKASILNLPR